MRLDILTLFPEMFAPLDYSIIKRARDKGIIEINYVNFRDYTANKQKSVDDSPFGGGAGMLLTAQPIVDCVNDIDPKHEAHRIFLTPAAPALTQEKVRELSICKRILLLCGHYEGVDQRAIDMCFDECISIGEYVLSGGELPAMVLADAVLRLVPGVLTKESLDRESFSNGTHHEHPQYTRPRDFRGLTVPDVLLSGNHAEIEKWKKDH